jgi:hypothetical protein
MRPEHNSGGLFAARKDLPSRHQPVHGGEVCAHVRARMRHVAFARVLPLLVGSQCYVNHFLIIADAQIILKSCAPRVQHPSERRAF